MLILLSIIFIIIIIVAVIGTVVEKRRQNQRRLEQVRVKEHIPEVVVEGENDGVVNELQPYHRETWIKKNKPFFYIDIGDGCKLLVTVSKKTIKEHRKDIENIKTIVKAIIISLTKNLDVETKNVLVGNDAREDLGLQKGDYTLDIYNCDTYMRDKSQWGNSNYEYLSDINGWEFLEGEKTDDGRDFSSMTFGVGGTEDVPRTSICIDDIICNGTNYLEESILVHEFAHTILETAIIESHPEWYEEFLRISELYNEIIEGWNTSEDPNKTVCPQSYTCDSRELFAIATQTWFYVMARDDVNRYIMTIDELKKIRRGTLSLYSFMEKVYGQPNNLCREIKKYPKCETKCRSL